MSLSFSTNFTIKKKNVCLMFKLLKLSLRHHKKLNGTLKNSVNMLEKETFDENQNEGKKLCLLIIYVHIKN